MGDLPVTEVQAAMERLTLDAGSLTGCEDEFRYDDETRIWRQYDELAIDLRLILETLATVTRERTEALDANARLAALGRAMEAERDEALTFVLNARADLELAEAQRDEAVGAINAMYAEYMNDETCDPLVISALIEKAFIKSSSGAGG